MLLFRGAAAVGASAAISQVFFKNPIPLVVLGGLVLFMFGLIGMSDRRQYR
ncbi:MAG TPA: hypothetical protein VGV69_03840 [Solirubrobacterales bacterium]|nr:hypothetical protein [Solirubrobacterales bacterium]